MKNQLVTLKCPKCKKSFSFIRLNQIIETCPHKTIDDKDCQNKLIIPFDKDEKWVENYSDPLGGINYGSL